MKKIFFLSVFIINSVSFADDKIINQDKKEQVNYCHNEIESKKWEGMLIKYAGEPDIMMLYALRIGLCKSVDDNKIKLDDAINIFYEEHQKVIKEWEDEARKNERKKSINI